MRLALVIAMIAAGSGQAPARKAPAIVFVNGRPYAGRYGRSRTLLRLS